MKKVIALIILSNLFIFLGNAQETAQPGEINYTHFTKQEPKITNELETQTSKEFKNHPEYGVLPFNSPCKDCIELLQKRDEKHRYFVKEGTNGHEFYSQTGYSNLNYQDASGHLVTIDYRIKPTAENGVFAASHQPFPLTVNMRDKYVSINNGGKELLVNRNVTLSIKKADGTIVSMGEPSWSNYTAGDDGIVIHNFYPGIDLELKVGEGHVESFYRINKPLHLDGGELVIHDNVQLPAGFVYDHSFSDKNTDDRYEGPLFINSGTGKHYFIVAGPAAYDENKSRGEKDFKIHIPYSTGQNGGLDLYMPIAWMNDPNRSYPLLIDPFVTATDSLPQAKITSSGYSPTCFAGGCAYHLNVPVPTASHVVDILYSFWYEALGTCTLDSAAFDLTTGSCRYPNAGTWKTCNSALPGICETTNISCYNNVQSCVPAPTCAVDSIPFTLTFYRCTSPGTCGNFSCVTVDPNHTWSMTVKGYTETATSTNATVCAGSTVYISATADSGIAPYTYKWYSPGGVAGTGDSISVSPNTTTTYTVTASECSGQDSVQSLSTVTITNGVAVAGPDTSICSGVTVQMHATGGNTYSWTPTAGLSNPNIANPIATPSVTTTYTVTATAGICVTTTTVTINVTPGGAPPLIYFIPVNITDSLPPFLITAGDSVVFAIGDSVAGGQVVHLNASSVLLNGGYNASVSFPDSGNSPFTRVFKYVSSCNDVSATPYKVTFSGAGNQSFCSGITGADTVYITVLPPPDILLDTIPNVFTPNGDHYNDTLTLYHLALREAEGATNCWSNLDMKIFNRWGELQYEYSSSTSLDVAWDGTNKSGDKVSNGVYYYILTADFMGKATTSKGTVEVKR